MSCILNFFMYSLSLFFSFRYGEKFVYSIVDWDRVPGVSFIVSIAILITGAIIHCTITYLHRVRVEIHRKICENRKTESKLDLESNLS